MRAGVAGCLLACLASLAPAVASAPDRSTYIVQFRAEPLASYTGDRSLAATSPKVTGRKLDTTSREAVEYRHYLDAIETVVLWAAGVPDAALRYSYRTTLAGFSAHLTAEEADRIRALSEVESVTADRARVLQPQRSEAATAPAGESPVAAGSAEPYPAAATAPTATSPDTDLGGQTADFLGLPDGLWARLGGPDHAGEDIVVGVIDTGIYPEHPSFADEPIAADGSRNYIGPAYGPPPATWHGTCQAGEAFAATSCNNKLIGARFFLDGYGAANVADEDFLSPRDAEGHGTGTSASAAGNYGVDPSYQGNDLGIGIISGIAPRARIASYKALWAIPAFGGAGFLTDSDLAAAIDAAVADGVDVLNLSIGGLLEPAPFTDQSTMLRPPELALLRAFDAGVVSVAAAGNDGPDPETIESPADAPWVISAGASALSTTFAATATVSGGPDGPIITAQGISPTPALDTVPLIDGAAAARPRTDPAQAGRCTAGTLDPVLVKGRAVLCRPTNAVVASAVLSDLGAAGAVFYFEGSDSRYTAEDVWLPSIVVSATDGRAIRQLVTSSPSPTVALTAGTATPTTTGDIVARFSGRGPALAAPSVLKPDVLAPGDILTAQSPDVPAGAGALFDFTQPGNLFRVLAGTSFSTSNIAGAAALLLALDPDLSPSGVKSALMTTANPQLLQDTAGVPSVPATDPTDIGAGRIDPNRAADPGLVLNETTGRFRDFVAAQVPTRDPAQPTVDASDLNLPSIAFDPLIGRRSTRRTFTSVDAATGTWRAALEGLAGIDATFQPLQFSIEPGASQTLEFSFDPGRAAAGRYVDGAVVLTNDDGRTVRLPIVLRPEPFEVAEQLNFGATQADGRAPLAAPTGYQGQLSALGYGLAPPDTHRNQAVGQDDPSDAALERLAEPHPGVALFDLQVPAGAAALAVEIGGAAISDPLTDLDLYVFHDNEGDGFRSDDLIEAGGFAESQEALLVLSPDPGAYRISVRGFLTHPVATFDLTTWLIADPTPDVLSDPPGPGLQISGDPATVTPGGTANLEVEWRGLGEPGTYLGLITYHDAATPDPDNPLAETILAITRHGQANSPVVLSRGPAEKLLD